MRSNIFEHRKVPTVGKRFHVAFTGAPGAQEEYVNRPQRAQPEAFCRLTTGGKGQQNDQLPSHQSKPLPTDKPASPVSQLCSSMVSQCQHSEQLSKCRSVGRTIQPFVEAAINSGNQQAGFVFHLSLVSKRDGGLIPSWTSGHPENQNVDSYVGQVITTQSTGSPSWTFRPISHLPIYLLIYQLYLAALLSQLGALPSHDELNDSHVSSSSPCTPAHVLPCAQVPHLTKVKVLQRFHGLVEELSQQSNVECSLWSTVTTEHWQHISSQEGVQTYKIRDHILRC